MSIRFPQVTRRQWFWLLAAVVALFGVGRIAPFAYGSDDPFPFFPDDLDDSYVAAAATPPVVLGGYTSQVSVAQGESLDFHLSSSNTVPFAVRIYREGATRTLMATVQDITAQSYGCNGGYATGCGWPVAFTLTIPSDWPSGVYTADIPMHSGAIQKAIFWVREDAPGSTAGLLFLSSVNTFQAYNSYGGKSLYSFNSTDGQPATKVSFNRPYDKGGLGKYMSWETKFVTWLGQQGYAAEYAATSDLEFHPTLLDPYRTVVIAGHSEYWTWNMRQRLRAFIDRGGRLVNLAGNTMWWQVRYEDNGRTMVGYKSYRTDPATDRTEEADNPWAYPIYDPPAAIMGAHWPFGGYPLTGPFSYNAGYGGYFVQNTGHWVFHGVGISDGQMLGRTTQEATAVLDHEVDGAPFNCSADGGTIMGTIANSGTPTNQTVLGVAPAFRNKVGFALIGIYTNPAGGGVFSVNSTGWVNALAGDAQVRQVTRNVLDRFLDPSPLPAEPPNPDGDLLFADHFNCEKLPHNWPNAAAPEWASLTRYNYFNVVEPTAFQFADSCGVEGGGLKISIKRSSGQQLITPVKGDWSSINAWYGRAHFDFRSLTIPEGASLDLVRFGLEANGVYALRAALQVRKRNGSLEFRLAPAGQTSAWVPAPTSQAIPVEWSWDKPNGRIGVKLADLVYEEPINLTSQSPGNRVDLGLIGLSSGVSGHLCVDDFAFDDQPLSTVPPADYTLNTQTIGQGAVHRLPDQLTYPTGTLVQLTAEPANGWVFSGWSGALTGNTNPASLIMNSNKAVTARFTPVSDPTAAVLLISSNANGSVAGLSYRDEDILQYNQATNSWALFFDGSDVGVGGVDVDALAVLENGQLLLSFDQDFTLTGFGAIDDADILKFTPTSLGATTAGSFELYLDGSDVGLDTTAEDIDAIDFAPDGRLLVSVLGAFRTPSANGADEDLMAFNATQLGSDTVGTWQRYFDGSVVGLSTSTEDVWALWVEKPSGNLYLGIMGAFAVPGLSGGGRDLILCTPTAPAPATSCTFSLDWHADNAGLTSGVIDGLHKGPPPTMPVGAAATDAVEPAVNDDQDEPDELDGEEDEETDSQRQQLYLPLIER